jgi:predicted ATPase/DNA-binding SARP family transcriptional activator
MRFGVLGPLGVWTTAGIPVRVPELKVRALLAVLLVHEGRPVSADRLIDALWDGEQRPGDPRRALQAKVSQLRRALEQAEPGGRTLVVSGPPGYVLQAGAEAVDAGRFAALTARARARDDSRGRAALLADALGLWRGPAFADFADQPFTRAAIIRLEEERLVVLEEQAEARLALGEHTLLVAELGDLVVRYPLRERLRAVQLRALYGAGRQGDALASYDDLRRRLAEELGVDPGPELAGLHRAILTQDPALTVAPGPATPATRPRTEDRPLTNLPAPLTDLIGREGAVVEVRSLLEAGRLVTLTGPGGVGKTRLAVETARRVVDTYPDGGWLVELAGRGGRPGEPDAARSPGGVAELVAATLGIRDDGTWGLQTAGEPVTLVDRLAGALRTKQLLLVLDNCEHLVEPVAELAELLLRAASGLHILTTSQEPLALAGEALWIVPPLEQPSAVELFTARAAAAAPGFTLDAHNAEAVTAICRRLDGIPLALELAATRVRALGVHGLLARLSDRFRLLATGHRGAPPRQQTLRAMIDWSWELLTGSERIVLRRLAMHAEGFTLGAAEAVCAGDDVPTEDVLDLLARLVDRSLVVVADGPDAPRYRLLESVAAYCIDRMREAGEFEHVRQRHLDHYVALAEQAESQLRGHAQRGWLERLDIEAANLRAALDGATQHDAADPALRLVNAMAWYWVLRGRLGEARRSLEAALAVEGDAAAARAQATAWHTGIAILEGNGADRTIRIKVALKLYEDIDDQQGHANARWFLGHALCGIGDLAAGAELIGGALDGFRVLGNQWGMAAALGDRAVQVLARGDLAAVERDGELSAALFRELGDRWGQVQTVYPLAARAEIFGDYDLAARLLRDGLRMAERLGLWTKASDLLSGLGRIMLLTGDNAKAREFHERAMRLAADQSFRAGEVNAELGLGLGARREGEWDIAEEHMRNVLTWHRQVGLEGANALILAELGFLAAQRGDAAAALALHLDGFAVARATGDPRAMALALEGLADAQTLAEHPARAAVLLGAAAAARQSTGAPLPPAERGDVERIMAAAREALGTAAFAAAFERGGKLKPDEARSTVARTAQETHEATHANFAPNSPWDVTPCGGGSRYG